ncbi:MAG: zinc ribbon domain-containing protein [Candidatus Korobacteraceae bacterium]
MKVWPMFCKVCGRSIQREDNFCPGCGAAIAREPFESAATVGSSTASAEMPAALADSAVEMQPPLVPAQNDAFPPVAQPRIVPPQALGEHIPPSVQERSGSSDASPNVTREGPLPTPPVRQFRRCPRCRRLNTGTDLLCDWCETELPPLAPALDPAANIVPPSFAGYANSNLASKDKETDTGKPSSSVPAKRMNRSTAVVRRRPRLPVLEILVIVLLLAGAGTAMWILRSSLPGKASAGSSVVVTITPASAEVRAGKALDFSASLSGTKDTQVIWTIQEGDDGGRVVTRGAKAKGGKVSSQAVYVAPSTPGTYHLLATSKANPQASASAEVTVTER